MVLSSGSLWRLSVGTNQNIPVQGIFHYWAVCKGLNQIVE